MTSSRFASGSVRGSPVYTPSTSLRMIEHVRVDQAAPPGRDSVSLSPKGISSTATVSFSFDDGDGAVFEQAQYRIPGIQMARRSPQIFPGQKDLGHHESVPAEQFFIHLHEQTLAHRSRGLQARQLPRALRQTELAPPPPRWRRR